MSRLLEELINHLLEVPVSALLLHDWLRLGLMTFHTPEVRQAKSNLYM